MAENKHNRWDLKQMQSLSLDAKITLSKRRIEEWHDYWEENGGGTYVSFSGGKDSTVLKHLVDSMYRDVPSVFVDTGLEYPEIRQFVHEIKDGKYPRFNNDIVILRPEKRFDEVIKEVGYPVISKEVADVVHGARIYLKDIKSITENGGGSPTLNTDMKLKKSIVLVDTQAENPLLLIGGGKSREPSTSGENKEEYSSSTNRTPRYSNRYRRIKGLGEYSKKSAEITEYAGSEQSTNTAKFP